MWERDNQNATRNNSHTFFLFQKLDDEREKRFLQWLPETRRLTTLREQPTPNICLKEFFFFSFFLVVVILETYRRVPFTSCIVITLATGKEKLPLSYADCSLAQTYYLIISVVWQNNTMHKYSFTEHYNTKKKIVFYVLFFHYKNIVNMQYGCCRDTFKSYHCQCYYYQVCVNSTLLLTIFTLCKFYFARTQIYFYNEQNNIQQTLQRERYS